MRQSETVIPALLLAACLYLPQVAGAQFKPPEVVKVFPPAAPVVAAIAETVAAPLRLEIAPGFHINADKPSLDYLIPTRLEWTSKQFKLLGVEYPKAERYTFRFSPDKPLDVYQGAITIRTRFQAPRGASPGKATLRGKLRYQACDDKACYPPVTVPVEALVEIRKRMKNYE